MYLIIKFYINNLKISYKNFKKNKGINLITLKNNNNRCSYFNTYFTNIYNIKIIKTTRYGKDKKLLINYLALIYLPFIYSFSYIFPSFYIS